MQDLTPKDYKKLKTKIQRELSRTEETATKAKNEICNESFWNIGESLNRLKAATHSTLKELARDTGKNAPFFYRVASFQKAWPRGLTPEARRISWSCHIELIPMTDHKCRDYYVRQCLEKDWPRNTLRKAIRKDEYALVQAGKLIADTLKQSELPYYTFKARVLRVIDGDTLEVEIDVGFKIKVTQTLRLRGINSAELKSQPETQKLAQKAKAFLSAQLEGLPFITIKTSKTDIYGRYVADVLYIPKDSKTSKPIFLNEEMIERGFAVRFG